MDTRLIRYYIGDIVLPNVGVTLEILFFVMIFTIIAGMALGCLLYMTGPDGLTPHPVLYRTLGLIVNIVRSVPVIIFMVLMIPVTRKLLGTSIGMWPAVTSISIMCTPFMARTIESRLLEVDKNLIEAALSMGLSNRQILLKYIVHAAVPSIVTGVSFAAVIFLGVITLAGTIGAGGIGAVAMNYGYKAFNEYVMYGSILILAVLVILIQGAGRILSRKLR